MRVDNDFYDLIETFQLKFGNQISKKDATKIAAFFLKNGASSKFQVNIFATKRKKQRLEIDDFQEFKI